MRVISARPSQIWTPSAQRVAERLQVSELEARCELRDAVKIWDADPRKATAAELHNSSDVRARLAAAAAAGTTTPVTAKARTKTETETAERWA